MADCSQSLSRGLLAFLALALSLGYSTPSRGEEPRPNPQLRLPKNTAITGLKLSPELAIENRNEAGGVATYIRMKGEYSDPMATLVSGSVRAKRGDDGSFELPIQITGSSTSFELLAIDPYGETVKEKYTIDFPGWESYHAQRQKLYEAEKNGIPNPLGISLGFSKISYTESQVRDYSATVLTAKGNYIRSLPIPRWNLGIGGFFTLAHLAQNYSANARFFGVNARVGYSLIPNPTIWRVGIYFGAYYTTMFVKNNQFGFYDMSGPQIFPVARRIFNRGRSASVYLKFAPLVSTSSFLSMASREIAAGVDYVFDFNEGRSHSVQLDLSSLNIQLPTQTMKVNTISISTSYAL